jgi:PKD repeat protein
MVNYFQIGGLIVFMMFSCVDADSPSPEVEVDFSANRYAIEQGDSIKFYSKCNIEADEWHWEFEGGSPAVADTKNPPGVIYQDIGSYDVSLIITVEGKQYQTNKTDYIIVKEKFYPDEFVFYELNSEKDTIIAGSSTKVWAVATGKGLRYYWRKNTGGFTGSGSEVSFFTCICFQGIAKISCKIEDQYGRSDEKEIQIVVIK